MVHNLFFTLFVAHGAVVLPLQPFPCLLTLFTYFVYLYHPCILLISLEIKHNNSSVYTCTCTCGPPKELQLCAYSMYLYFVPPYNCACLHYLYLSLMSLFVCGVVCGLHM